MKKLSHPWTNSMNFPQLVLVQQLVKCVVPRNSNSQHLSLGLGFCIISSGHWSRFNNHPCPNHQYCLWTTLPHGSSDLPGFLQLVCGATVFLYAVGSCLLGLWQIVYIPPLPLSNIMVLCYPTEPEPIVHWQSSWLPYEQLLVSIFESLVHV